MSYKIINGTFFIFLHIHRVVSDINFINKLSVKKLSAITILPLVKDMQLQV